MISSTAIPEKTVTCGCDNFSLFQAIDCSSTVMNILELPTSFNLSINVAGCPVQLQKALLPLLKERSAPIEVQIPALPRANGTRSQPFVFLAALRLLPKKCHRKLFPYRLKSLLEFSPAQCGAYEQMDEEDRLAYNKLYTEEEWLKSYNASRNVCKANSKAKKMAPQKSATDVRRFKRKATVQTEKQYVSRNKKIKLATERLSAVEDCPVSQEDESSATDLHTSSDLSSTSSDNELDASDEESCLESRTQQKIDEHNAEQGDASAQMRLGAACIKDREFQMAMKWYRQAAVQGNPQAQLWVGLAYEHGNHGAPRSLEEAVNWYLKVVDQVSDDPQYRYAISFAQCTLADMYSKGEGVEKSLSKAVELYRRSADHGFSGAQQELGTLYHFGRGVPESQEDAAKWWLKAAEQGDEIAQFNLGIAYKKGQGVEQSFTMAAELFFKAAKQGDPDAAHSLGIMFSEMDYGMQSKELAVKWWKRAVKQENPNSELQLGRLFESGAYSSAGIEKSLPKAIALYKKAAAHGNADAQQRLVELRNL